MTLAALAPAACAPRRSAQARLAPVENPGRLGSGRQARLPGGVRGWPSVSAQGCERSPGTDDGPRHSCTSSWTSRWPSRGVDCFGHHMESGGELGDAGAPGCAQPTVLAASSFEGGRPTSPSTPRAAFDLGGRRCATGWPAGMVTDLRAGFPGHRHEGARALVGTSASRRGWTCARGDARGTLT